PVLAVAPLRPRVREQDIDAVEEGRAEQAGQAIAGIPPPEENNGPAPGGGAPGNIFPAYPSALDRGEGGVRVLFRKMQQEFSLAGTDLEDQRGRAARLRQRRRVRPKTQVLLGWNIGLGRHYGDGLWKRVLQRFGVAYKTLIFYRLLIKF